MTIRNVVILKATDQSLPQMTSLTSVTPGQNICPKARELEHAEGGERRWVFESEGCRLRLGLMDAAIKTHIDAMRKFSWNEFIWWVSVLNS